MRNLIISTMLTFFTCIVSYAQVNEIQHYDSTLAAKFGADDYGMKQYVFANLVRGKIKIEDKAKSMEIQRGHMENIRRLANEGKLVLAGPYLDNTDVRGIFIFDVKTVEEAHELIETDPAIKAGVLDMELRPWYGSAALMEINTLHKKIAKQNP